MKQPTAKLCKVLVLRETPCAADLIFGDTPEAIHKYYKQFVETDPNHSKEVEQMYLFTLNTRRKITGHYLITKGLLDHCWVHPREVFRPAIVANASAIIILHNHPSGESTPSDADIKVTRDLIQAGKLLKIEVLDHLVVGDSFSSLRALGYFY